MRRRWGFWLVHFLYELFGKTDNRKQPLPAILFRRTLCFFSGYVHNVFLSYISCEMFYKNNFLYFELCRVKNGFSFCLFFNNLVIGLWTLNSRSGPCDCIFIDNYRNSIFLYLVKVYQNSLFKTSIVFP